MIGKKGIESLTLQGRFDRLYVLFTGKTDHRPEGQVQSYPTFNTFLDVFRNMALLELVLLVLIAVIIGFCLLFFFLAVLRRYYNARKYAILDRLRSSQLSDLKQCIYQKAPADEYRRRFEARPGSMKWLALEHNLFLLREADATFETAGWLFEELGYVDHYIRLLKGRKVIARALAISKLGRMGSLRAAGALLTMLDTENPEIIAVTVRAIGKFCDPPSLSVMLARLPGLLQKNLITRKTIDAALVADGPCILPALLDFGNTCTDAALTASLLVFFNDFPANQEVCAYAAFHLTHNDAEVRARAVKLMAHCVEKLCLPCDDSLPPLLNDPVWFVRLQAVRSLGRRRQQTYIPAIAALVLDAKWQVRNEAAQALTMMGRDAVDAFLTLLRSDDLYAKESVCEEMEKAGFVDVLLDLLESDTTGDAVKAREILTVMASLGFTAPMVDYLAAAHKRQPACAAEIQAILDGARR